MSSINGSRTQKTSPEPPPRATFCHGRSYRAFLVRFQGALRAAPLVALIFGSAAGARAEPFRVVALGDSLTAGFALPADATFPVQLERRLQADGVDAKVVNAGVSGETTAGGLARIGFALGEKTDLVILELGANDMLRGVDPKFTRANLEKIIAQIKARGSAVVLAGMLASINFGPEYKARFDAIFPDIAKAESVPIYPFFLAGVAGDERFVLPDGLHPNAEGAARIAAGIAPLVEKTLEAARPPRAGR